MGLRAAGESHGSQLWFLCGHDPLVLPASSPNGIPLLLDPLATSTTVAFPASVALAPYTDPYFRGFDNSFPDYYRYKEWEREFDTNYAKAGGEELPSLSLVRFMHDHTGNFDTAIDGVNTPELHASR